MKEVKKAYAACIPNSPCLQVFDIYLVIVYVIIDQ